MATLQRKTYKLLMGSKRGAWRDRKGGMTPSDRQFEMARPKVLERDRHACVFCGFSMPGMHVHHVDDNHENNRPDNLATAEDLCHAVNHVGLLGKQGAIIYMPGVTQEDVVHLCRTIAVAVSFGGEIGEKARRLADLIVERFGRPVAQLFGTDNPADFGNALIALSDDGYNARGIPLRDIRVFFKPDALSGGYAARARKAVFDNIKPDTWQRIYEDFENRSSV